MSESYNEAAQRLFNQRAENLMEAHRRIKELEAEKNEKNEEIRELKRIIAESQTQKPVAWRRNELGDFYKEDGFVYYESDCHKDAQALFASPVIQEGMQLVGEKSENGVEWKFANTVHDMPVGTKLYAKEKP